MKSMASDIVKMIKHWPLIFLRLQYHILSSSFGPNIVALSFLTRRYLILIFVSDHQNDYQPYYIDWAMICIYPCAAHLDLSHDLLVS